MIQSIAFTAYPVSEAVSTPVCRFAIVQDPDGNAVILHKRHPQGA